MNDSAYHPELTDPRVGYATRYENEGQAADRAAPVTARAARAMRDGDRYMEGRAQDLPTQGRPGSLRMGPNWGNGRRSPVSAGTRIAHGKSGSVLRAVLRAQGSEQARQEAADREAGA